MSGAPGAKIASGLNTTLIGHSPVMLELNSMIQRVAQSKTNILVLGESGTGKELVARMIHESGTLKAEAFVPVNCGAIPENLIETEMFGHRKGSFTGAISDKQGLFHIANGGTLFLDEVGELSLTMQAKLLRAIQEKKIRKVGGLEDTPVDVRIIAATNRDLEAAVAEKKFREDLYYRLNVILIRTPPLRERAGDIRILAEFFLRHTALRMQKKGIKFAEEALLALENYSWPGNVRELQNVIERAVTLSNQGIVDLETLPTIMSAAVSSSKGSTGKGGKIQVDLPAADFENQKIELEKVLSQVERIYLLAALKSAGGSRKRAADLLGLSLRSLRYRLAKQNLP